LRNHNAITPYHHTLTPSLDWTGADYTTSEPREASIPAILMPHMKHEAQTAQSSSCRGPEAVPLADLNITFCRCLFEPTRDRSRPRSQTDLTSEPSMLIAPRRPVEMNTNSVCEAATRKERLHHIISIRFERCMLVP